MASSITITFAAPTSKTAVKPTSVTYPYEKQMIAVVRKWTEVLLQAAYGNSKRRKRLKVLINPFGGLGTAVHLFETRAKNLFHAARCALDIQVTRYRGHAIHIAEDLDIDAYDAVVCCSGDGLPHEVFNGLGKRQDALKALQTIAVCQLPAGSGNAMSWNLTGNGDVSGAALEIIKGIRKKIDLISISQGESRLLSFLSQSFGIVAEADLGTEDLRWMGGARFTYGVLRRVWTQSVYPCDIAVKVAIDDKESIRRHFKEGNLLTEQNQNENLSNLNLPELKFGNVSTSLPPDWNLVHQPHMGIFYAGNMAWMSAGSNFFPASLPHEGLFDLVSIDGTIGRFKAMNILLSVVDGSHFDLPDVSLLLRTSRGRSLNLTSAGRKVSYRKVEGYRIIPHKRQGVNEEFISIDGERIPFAPFQAEVHSGLGTVLAKGDFYQGSGV